MMKDQITTIPVGTPVLGRVLNAHGDPIDKQGSFGSDVRRIPLYTPESTRDAQGITEQMFETGIKAIDLLAPIPRGGITGMFSEPGLGKMVVMEEIIHNMFTQHSGYMVCVGMGENTYEASELRDMIRDVEAENKAVMLFEKTTEGAEFRRQLLYAALTIAIHFREQGHEVLFIVGKQVITKDNLADLHILKQAVKVNQITTFLFEPIDESEWPERGKIYGELDAQIIFSHALPKQDLWPAIDRLSSDSRLLESDVLKPEHRELARQVKQLIQSTDGLQADSDTKGLSEEDQRLLKQAQRVHQFLTQPFFVAEAYTDIPGEYVKIEDTLRSFKELLEGRYDDLPAKAFWFVGTIEQAVIKAQSQK